MNSVDYLLEKKFSLHTTDEKIKIITLGRPMPDLKLIQVIKKKTRQFTRSYTNDTYTKYNNGLCGCDKRNAVFCFPCLLFGGEMAWTKTGMTDLNHLNDRMKKHDLTVKHMNNTLNLATLGKTNVLSMLDSSYRRGIYLYILFLLLAGRLKTYFFYLGIELHNEKVSNNRYILNVIINCIRFCGTFELALRGHDEKDTSLNPGIFRGLISFSAELDSTLKVHLEKATVFKGTSKTIQNELLKCMINICQQEISVEIKKADYLAITADETTDVSAIFQMIIVCRYIVNDKVVERFWGFLKP